jgi:eukaryotic-like serine/threonine-protein kinase
MKETPGFFEKLIQSWLFRQSIMLIGAFIGFILLVVLFLRLFTHHGESLVMPDYVGEYLEIAEKDAKSRSFQMEVFDSVFIVGKNGGLILSQNPLYGEKVKRKRKVYVTVTKSKPDEISSGRLPILYGKSYDRKSRELKSGFELFTKVVGYKYDAGPENYILSVIYEGDTIISGSDRKLEVMIEKGGTLEFILSKSTGGSIDLPNMVCKTHMEAMFIAKALKVELQVGDSDDLDDISNAYIYRQEPPFSPGSKMVMGDTIYVYLRQSKPDFCQDTEED